MNFDFDSQTRRKLGYQLIEVVDRFFTSLADRPVQPAAEDRIYPPRLSRLPETGEDPGQVLDHVCGELVDNGFHVPSAHYLGMMNPTRTYMAFLAESLVAALNPQLASLDRSQTASRIEAETVRWVGELVGWQTAPSGTFTTGGNEANLSALAMALSARFPGVIENGLASIGTQPVFYASMEGHHSLDKSAGLLGLGRKALRRIPVNERLQLNVQQLEAAIKEDLESGKKPFCIVATAGTTSSGAIDDIPRIHEICRRYNIWLHVDGADGPAVLFSHRHRGAIRAINVEPDVVAATNFVNPRYVVDRPRAGGSGCSYDAKWFLAGLQVIFDCGLELLHVELQAFVYRNSTQGPPSKAEQARGFVQGMVSFHRGVEDRLSAYRGEAVLDYVREVRGERHGQGTEIRFIAASCEGSTG